MSSMELGDQGRSELERIRHSRLPMQNISANDRRTSEKMPAKYGVPIHCLWMPSSRVVISTRKANSSPRWGEYSTAFFFLPDGAVLAREPGSGNFKFLSRSAALGRGRGDG